MPIIKCDYCEKEFYKRPSDITKSENNFCCLECKRNYLNIKVKLYCNTCNKEFEKYKNYVKYNNFCSKKCKGIFKRKQIEISCDRCNEKFFKKLSAIKDKNYCSVKCKIQASKKINSYKINNEITTIYIKSKKYGIFNVLIDTEDFEKIKNLNWTLLKHKDRNLVYARSNNILMHRLIMNCPDDKVIDHINHNGIDNRKSNMRICTIAENCQNIRLPKSNRSGARGVFWNKRYKKWQGFLFINKKSIHTGMFSNLKEAAIVTKEARKKHMPFSTF